MSELNLKCPADFNHNCPGDWDDDYRSIWVQLQVQQHNKMQYRKAWKESKSELTAARDEAERLRGRVAELELEQKVFSAPVEVDRSWAEAKILRKQAEAVERFGQEIGVFDPEYDDQGYVEIPRREVKAYAQCLRKQADEADKAGGGQ